jgi:ABC-2 type transport system permease protein
MGVWLLFGSVIAVPGMTVATRLAGLETGPDVLVLAAVYFVLGYFFFASVMAAVGAVSPSFKESGALTFMVLLPAWIPFFALEAILADPNGRAATIFSLFPPTAPLVGVMRVVSAPVPPIELALSYLLLLASGVAVLWAAARLFSSPMLLSAGPPSARALVAAVRRGHA